MFKKKQLIFFFGFYILLISTICCSKPLFPGKDMTQKTPDEQLLYSNHKIKLPSFNKPYKFNLLNDVKVTPKWNKLRKSKSGGTYIIPLKMSKKVYLKSSKKDYGDLSLIAFMLIKKDTTLKKEEEERIFVFMANSDSQKKKEDLVAVGGGNKSDIQFVSISKLDGFLLYALVFVDDCLEYLIMPSNVPIIDPNFQDEPDFNAWLETNNRNNWKLNNDIGVYYKAYKSVKRDKKYKDIANWGIVRPDLW